MASSTHEAVRAAADRVRRERGVELDIAFGKGDIACGGGLEPHADALFRLFSLGLDLAKAPRVVLRPDPLGWLHMRGEGIPRMGEGLAPAPFREAMAIEAALRAVRAYLLLDAGGFLVIYEKVHEEQRGEGQ